MNPWVKDALDILIITISCLAYAAAWSVFILPYGIVTGGVTGLSNILFYSLKINVAVSYLAVNALLYLAALKFLGLRFLAKTMYATAALTFFLWIGQALMTGPSGELVHILGKQERFMALLIGCSVCGAAIATMFNTSGSSGGTDILAAIANKYFGVSVGSFLMVIDFLIVGSSLFMPGMGARAERIEFVAFGLCAMAVECAVINHVMNLSRRSVQFMIFSRKHERVAKEIARVTGHTMTLLDGHGHYTGQDIKVICMLARMRESAIIFAVIRRADPEAFVSQSRVIGVYGDGFDALLRKRPAEPR
ncbi:MAG: YitT family protein [Kiritimatiellae bacterium]|nr:YitT family protein [Kiritimatiellia bacterium]